MAEKIISYQITVRGTEQQVKELTRHEIALKKLGTETRAMEKDALILAKRNREGGIVFKGLTKSISENRAKIIDLRTEKNKLAKSLRDESKLNQTIARTIGQVNAQLSIEKARINDVVVGSKKFNIIARRIKDLETKQRNFNQQLGRGRTFVGEYSKGAVDAFQKVALAVGGALIAFRTLQRLTGGVIDTIKEFDESIANLRKTTGLTKDTAIELAKEIIAIDTKTSVTNLLALATAGGRLGLEGQELIDFTKQTDKAFVSLGDSLDGSAEDIGLTLGKLAGNFKLEEKFGIGDAINKIGSVLNELGATTKAQEEPIIDFTQRLAGVAVQAKISLPDIAALGALFDESGVSIEVAATTFNKLLPAIGKDVERFAAIAGMNVEEFRKVVEKDAFEALKLVAEGAQSSQEGLIGLTETLESFGVKSGRAASIVGILASKTERLTEIQEISNRALEEGVSITEEFNIKNETLIARQEKLNKAYDVWIINLEDGQGAIATAIGGITDLATSYLETVVAVDKMNELNKKFQETNFQDTIKEISEHVKQGTTDTKEFTEAQLILKLQLTETFGKVEGIKRYNQFMGLAAINAKRLQEAQEKLTNASKEQQDVLETEAAERVKALEKIIELRKIQEKNAEEMKKIREQFAEERRLALLTEEKRELDALKKRIVELKKAGADEEAIKEFNEEQFAKITKKFREKDATAEIKAIQDRVKAEQDGMALRLLILTQEFNEGVITEEEFKREKLRIRKETLEGIKDLLEAEVNDMTASLEAVNIEESLLSDEQKDELKKKIQEVKTELSGIVKALETEDEEPFSLAGALGLDDKTLDSIFASVDTVVGVLQKLNEFQQTLTNEAIKRNDKETQSKIEAIDAQIERAELQNRSTKTLEDQKTAIIKANADKTLQIQKEQFEKSKDIALARAIVNMAMGILEVIGAEGTGNFIVDAILKGLEIAAIVVAGGLEIATIEETTFKEGGILKMPGGGVLKGKSHEEGGIPFNINGRSGFEAEGGEILVNKNIHTRPDYVDAISQMNYLTGGKKFQRGAVLPSQNVIRRLTPQPITPLGITREEAVELVQEGIATIKVEQVESEVTETQKTVETIESGAEF